VQDYDNHGTTYKPDVVQAKIRQRNADDFQVYFRFFKKKLMVEVTFNTEHDAHYFRLSPTRVGSRSRTTRIAEVENPGQPTEREKPVGNDRGYLWRLNTYWLYEEKEGGVYVQLETISLTRGIPFPIDQLPIIKSMPRESLTFTLATTRSAVLNAAKRAAASK
jgi:hypothetical protein